MLSLTRLSCAALLLLFLPFDTSASADGKSRPDCHMYFGNVCFSAFYIQKQVITFPVDFAIDEIDLSDGAHVTIYEGVGLAEQDDVTNLTKAKVAGGAVVYIGQSSHGRYFDVHFAPEKRGQIVQIFGYIHNAASAKRIGAFVSSIQACVPGELKVECGAGSPLDGAGDFLATQSP